MKLILTEDQYKLLETILDEAAVPMSTKIEKGGFIQVVYILNDTEKSQTMEITDVYGTGKYAKGVNKDGEFLINIGGSLDTVDNSFTVLKDGQYQEGGKDENGKIIAPQVVGGIKQKRKNVTQVNISDSNKEVVDRISTNLGDEMKSSGEDEEADTTQDDLDRTEKEKQEREKRIYDLMVSDPILKKAFYHQPKLFGGLLNYGKARGIGPAKALLSKYIGGYNAEDKEDGTNKSKFKIGNKVKFILTDSINITYGAQTFMLVGKKEAYSATYKSSGILLSRVKMPDGEIYKYYIKDIKNIKGDIYSGNMIVEFIGKHSGTVNRSKDVTFKITEYIN